LVINNMEIQQVISITVEPKTDGDRQRLQPALRQLAQSDPTFETIADPETGHTIIHGMGEIHLEILIDRLKREHGVEVISVGNPQILYRGRTEPIMAVEVTVPEDLVSTVSADLRSRRGRIESVEPRGQFQAIRAIVPLAELLGYATHLRAQTHHGATFSMQFAHYEERSNK
jgi:translation elongation factor EF-G